MEGGWGRGGALEDEENETERAEGVVVWIAGETNLTAMTELRDPLNEEEER